MAAIFLLVLSAPFIILIYFSLFFVQGEPIFFRQRRGGQNRVPFTIFKFRTMKYNTKKQKAALLSQNEAPAPMFKLKNDPRFTKLGKFLSLTGLDELPQLWNVLRGEMSLVGPRPLPIEEIKNLSPRWNFRFNVRPGLVSYWALSPNRFDSLQTWFKLERQELQEASIIQDITLLITTLARLAQLLFTQFFSLAKRRLR